MRRIFLQEPLIHFAMAAIVVFTVHNLIGQKDQWEDRIIQISHADLQRLASLYTIEAGTPPGEQQMEALIYDHVRQVALAREARHLGLDTGDTVIERRLAQKMGFMISDLSEPEAPGEEALRDWYKTYPERFTQAELLTFEHVYFTQGQEAEARKALEVLETDPATDWKLLGAPFMLRKSYAGTTALEIRRLFGEEFAAALPEITHTGSWTGPVSSSLGQHLVRITERTPSVLPEFTTVRAQVESDWMEAERRAANMKAETEIIASYKIEIEGAR